jgi:hypothetical protein
MDEVDQRSRSQLIQRNEQVKSISGLTGNAGLALGAAGAGRWFVDGVDEYSLFWLLAGAALMWVGVKSLTMLEAET